MALNDPDLASVKKKRRTAFSERWKWYNGDHPDVIVVPRGDPNDNTFINYAELFVDKGVSFLCGQDVDLEEKSDVRPTPGERTDSEKWLDDDLFDQTVNNKMLLFSQIATNGGVCGTAFGRIWPQLDNVPKIRPLDPAMVTPHSNEDDYEDVYLYEVEWTTFSALANRVVWRRQLIERLPDLTWMITDQESRNEGKSWEMRGEPEPWPWLFSPIVHCQNLPKSDSLWGKSDLGRSVLELVYAVNSVATNSRRTVRVYGHPRTWGRNLGDIAKLDTRFGRMLNFKSDKAHLENLAVSGDLAGSTAVWDRLTESLFEVARVSRVATGKMDNIGQLSGLALKILYGPLLEKTEHKRLTYGPLFTELTRRAFIVAGQGDDLRLTPVFQDPVPVDEVAEVTGLTFDKSIGVSDDTIMRKRGYDPDVESEKNAAEGIKANIDGAAGATLPPAGGGVFPPGNTP